MAGGAYSTITPCFASSFDTDCCQSTGYGAECYDPQCYECDPTNGKLPISCVEPGPEGDLCLACGGGMGCDGDCHCVSGNGCICSAPGSDIHDSGRCILL